MKKIELTKEHFTMVDDEDYHYLNRFSWCLYEKDGLKYAITNIGSNTVYLQQMVMPTKKQFYMKHKNNNTLDNRKENLEMISINHRRHLGSKKQIGYSKYRGVQKANKHGTEWRAVIAKDKMRYFLGKFKSEKQAAKAYNLKARELYGSFAFQNVL